MALVLTKVGRTRHEVQRGLEIICDRHPEWLAQIKGFCADEGRASPTREILQRIAYPDRKTRTRLTMTPATMGLPASSESKLDFLLLWMKVHLAAGEIDHRMTSCALELFGKGARDLLWTATKQSDPDAGQVRAALLISQTFPGQLSNIAATSSDIDYVANHLDQVEGILPELQARQTFDRGTIEMLLASDAVVPLREGEL